MSKNFSDEEMIEESKEIAEKIKEEVLEYFENEKKKEQQKTQAGIDGFGSISVHRRREWRARAERTILFSDTKGSQCGCPFNMQRRTTG